MDGGLESRIVIARLKWPKLVFEVGRHIVWFEPDEPGMLSPRAHQARPHAVKCTCFPTYDFYGKSGCIHVDSIRKFDNLEIIRKENEYHEADGPWIGWKGRFFGTQYGNYMHVSEAFLDDACAGDVARILEPQINQTLYALCPPE